MIRPLCAFLLLSVAMPAVSDSVKMWRDASGRVHFGDAPPPAATSGEVDVTPHNRTGTYGGEHVVEEAVKAQERARRLRYDPRDSSGGDAEMRALEQKKRAIEYQLKHEKIPVGHRGQYRRELERLDEQIGDIRYKLD